VPRSERVEIKIFDAAGRLIRGIEQMANAGENVAYWDGAGQDGRTVAAGVYFYQIKAGDFVDKRRMVLVE
jgi:flagellar hook assembly protein FlgD